MDDGHTDDQTQGFEPRDRGAGDATGDETFDTSPESDPWPGVGARRGPRPPAEGVRIIGAEEAAAAIESGQATRRSPDDMPRFGDVPEPPPEPRPPLRFPGVDPASVTKPPLAEPIPPPESAKPGRPPERDSYVEDSFWGESEEQPATAGAGDGSPPGRFFSADAGDPSSQRPPEGHVAGSFGDELEREHYGRSTMDDGFDDESDFFDSPAPPPERPYGAGDRGPERPYGAGEPEGPDRAEDAGPGRPLRAGDTFGGTLPHWTEPPSGEVPRILADTEPPEEPDDDLKAWSTLASGPRWRDQATDWDDSDFAGAEILDDPEMRVGALRSELPEESFEPDEPLPPAEAPLAGPSRRPQPGGRAAGAAGVRRKAVRSGGRGAGASPRGQRQPSAGGMSQMRGRELQLRVLTGAIVLAVLLAAAAMGPGALTFLVGVALVMAGAELYQTLRTRGYHPATLLGLAAIAAFVAVIHWDKEPSLVLVLLIVFSLLWYLVGVSHAPPLANVAATVFGFIYVGFLGSYAAVMLSVFGDDGIGLLLGAILATAAYDTGAYFVGVWTGKTPLMPHVSPGKTVEGLVGGTFAALVMCLLVVRAIFPWDGGKAFWLALVVSVAAPLGDLCESLIKRDLDVKDMGSLVPGHGGVLDRIDALLFVVPATYYLFRVLA